MLRDYDSIQNKSILRCGKTKGKTLLGEKSRNVRIEGEGDKKTGRLSPYVKS